MSRANSIPCGRRRPPQRPVSRGAALTAPLLGTHLAKLLAQLVALARRHAFAAQARGIAASPLLRLLAQFAPQPLAFVGVHARAASGCANAAPADSANTATHSAVDSRRRAAWRGDPPAPGAPARPPPRRLAPARQRRSNGLWPRCRSWTHSRQGPGRAQPSAR